MARDLAGRPLWALILVFIAIQVWFATEFQGLRPAIEEMPPPPTDRALKAMALGDDEFLFRHFGRWLEFVGDGGGRVRPLRFYDYDRVVGWMQALDRLDADRSDFVHFIAARYFGEITKAVDTDHQRVRKIVEYLRIVALSDPARRWQWMVWAADKARHDLNDPALVKAIAHDLQSPELVDPRVPAWVRVLPVRLYIFAGDLAAAHDAEAHISPRDAAEVKAMKDQLVEAIRQWEQQTGLQPKPNAP
jgi:hypothetical protein